MPRIFLGRHGPLVDRLETPLVQRPVVTPPIGVRNRVLDVHKREGLLQWFFLSSQKGLDFDLDRPDLLLWYIRKEDVKH